MVVYSIYDLNLYWDDKFIATNYYFSCVYKFKTMINSYWLKDLLQYMIMGLDKGPLNKMKNDLVWAAVMGNSLPGRLSLGCCYG